MSDYRDHPEYAAFIAGMKAEPEDDTRRLVFADWLDDHGQHERAEFVRVQIERDVKPDRASCDICRRDWSRVNKSSYPVPMSWCPACRTDGPFWPDAQEALRLRSREMELLALHGHEWGGGGLIHRGRIGPLFHNEDGSDPRPICRWSRGFVSSVSAPLVTLIGGDCERCEIWTTRGMPADKHCPTCHGTGTVPGVLRSILRDHPVQRVEVTDREPGRDERYTGPIAHWQSADQSQPSWVPPELIEEMYRAEIGGPDDTGEANGRTSIHFVTTAAARAALSAALLQICEDSPRPAGELA